MRSVFAAYFRPSEEDFKQLWQNCFFVFDTNVLLTIYEYSKPTRDTLTTILEHVKERAWLPHHVGWEFIQNRIEVISNQVKEYSTNKTNLDDVLSKLQKTKGHPFVSDKVLANLKTAIDATKAEFEQSKLELEKLYTDDPYLALLAGIFDKRTGEPYDDVRMGLIDKEGQKRYPRQIPPGYKDKIKVPEKDLDPSIFNQSNRFGDLVIWNQMIDEAMRQNRPLIFVTDDDKEDFWIKHQERSISPRPELIEEFATRPKQSFYMYNSPQFMKHANSYFNLDVKKAAIEEAQSIFDKRGEDRRPPENTINIFTTDPANGKVPRILRKNDSLLPAGRVSKKRILHFLERLFDKSSTYNELIDSLVNIRMILQTKDAGDEVSSDEIRRYRRFYNILMSKSDGAVLDERGDEEIADRIMGAV